MFRLKGAPRPTLLAGNKSMFLVTAEDEALKVIPVEEQTSDFCYPAMARQRKWTPEPFRDHLYVR